MVKAPSATINAKGGGYGIWTVTVWSKFGYGGSSQPEIPPHAKI